MVCTSVRFDIIKLLTDLKWHSEPIHGNLSPHDYFLLKTENLLNSNCTLWKVDCNWHECCWETKGIFHVSWTIWIFAPLKSLCLLHLICPSRIKYVIRVRRDASIAFNSQTTGISCALKTIVTFFVCTCVRQSGSRGSELLGNSKD